MELPDAISLIEKGVQRSADRQIWADLGAGNGLFSTALSTLIPAKSTIYAVDSNRSVLSKIKLSSSNVDLITLNDNFTNAKLRVPNLDGIIMANSLHFVPNKLPVLQNLKWKLKPNGRMIIIEYDINKPNAWVPYPIMMMELHSYLKKIGFSFVEKIAERPSVYNASIMYSTLALD
jgi:ubiquinone/menaquinone biosynthesis C-methylase UbiE